MRPRIQVAILGATPLARSVLNVVLDSRGYRPVRPRGQSWLKYPHPRLRVALLVGLDAAGVDYLQQALARHGTNVRTVSVAQRGMLPEAVWIADLLERVRLAAIRKRKRSQCSAENVSFHARRRR